MLATDFNIGYYIIPLYYLIHSCTIQPILDPSTTRSLGSTFTESNTPKIHQINPLMQSTRFLYHLPKVCFLLLTLFPTPRWHPLVSFEMRIRDDYMEYLLPAFRGIGPCTYSLPQVQVIMGVGAILKSLLAIILLCEGTWINSMTGSLPSLCRTTRGSGSSHDSSPSSIVSSFSTTTTKDGLLSRAGSYLR